MAYQRSLTATNTVKLHFDPDTWDLLKAQAAAAKDTVERVAYRMLQSALAKHATPLGNDPAASEPPAFDLASLPSFRSKPGGD